jgi:hypothetical protein
MYNGRNLERGKGNQRRPPVENTKSRHDITKVKVVITESKCQKRKIMAW